MMMQTAMTLLFGAASDAQIPNLGARGAIAAVLGAYIVLYPNSRIRTLVAWFPISIPAWLFFRWLVPLPVLRGQPRADPSRQRRRQWRRVLRACRRIRLRRDLDADPPRRQPNHAKGDATGRLQMTRRTPSRPAHRLRAGWHCRGGMQHLACSGARHGGLGPRDRVVTHPWRARPTKSVAERTPHVRTASGLASAP
jgi:hypothetical protein